MIFRKANINDAKALLSWRNDPDTRANSLSTDPIDWEEHLVWLDNSIRNPNRHLLIALNEDEQEVGTVRFDFLPAPAGAYEISWTVAPKWRRKGIGTKMVQAALLQPFLAGHSIRARMKRINIASQKIATAADFARWAVDGGIEEWWRGSVNDGESPMIISVLVDNPQSWFVGFGHELVEKLKVKGCKAVFVHNVEAVGRGDICFLLSCERIVKREFLARNKHNIVIHSSPLPQGKGMSPLTWQILEGKNEIPTTLFEAQERVDSGDIYLQRTLHFNGHELLDEMQTAQGCLVVEMALEYVEKCHHLKGRTQQGVESIYRRRTAKDSELDPQKSIAKQFNLLRVVSNERYPAFFRYKGHAYILKIYKKDGNDKI